MQFSEYLKTFDYQERQDMKIGVAGLIYLLERGEVQVVDIRFTEEAEAWGFDFIKKIPLNELPERMDELDRDKIIVTVCPHYDRASIARHYLTLNGFKSRYLVDGLLGLASYLRGDTARDFVLNTIK